VQEAARRIAESRRPLIISGGGIRYSRAEESLRELSDTMGIPVAETLAGRGTAQRCELVSGGLGFIGSSAANAIAGEADLVIAAGTRLTDAVTGSRSLFQDPDVTFISVNASRFDLAKMNGLAVEGDARAVIDELARELKELSWKAPPAWESRVRSVLAGWRSAVSAELAATTGQLRGYQVVDAVARFAAAGDRVVLASSTAVGYAHAFWNSQAECDLEYGFSCMGYEIPAALGHRLARPDADVYAVLGDGTYLMGNTGEFVTAVQERASFTAIVLVNHGFQCIRSFEEGAFGAEFGTQFRERDLDGAYRGPVVQIDYAANARSLGCRAFDVSSRAELVDALTASRQGEGPCFIAVHVSDEGLAVPAGAWWDYGSPEIGTDPEVGHRHAVYLAQAADQRWYM
jgi:3D-(3,5/4)-trihydroxycyclohexane-1,2-dione acylhydrolase (decyclizing)